MKEQVLMCPVCGGALFREGGSLKCENGHSFDFAKEGYVNLLLGSRSTQRMGDSRESAKAASGQYGKNCTSQPPKKYMPSDSAMARYQGTPSTASQG